MGLPPAKSTCTPGLALADHGDACLLVGKKFQSPSSFRVRANRSSRLFWKAGSFFLVAMCSSIAVLITSDIGCSSMLATVSNASDCSMVRRTVITLTGFVLIFNSAPRYRTCQMSTTFAADWQEADNW